LHLSSSTIKCEVHEAGMPSAETKRTARDINADDRKLQQLKQGGYVELCDALNEMVESFSPQYGPPNHAVPFSVYAKFVVTVGPWDQARYNLLYDALNGVELTFEDVNDASGRNYGLQFFLCRKYVVPETVENLAQTPKAEPARDFELT